ncbi:hypothetical protein NECAME_00051 [Necator americanus]|uniref:Uncharacterized protein n=1 Tax=Necator americanus TaxID=51031 RepID=W2U1I3_NECAM|nr:hypothetical protein NECAME_00051 [Necator americanus]ETN87192.1 hypothetical protein NECAME_00051 [Necator americanus]
MIYFFLDQKSGERNLYEYTVYHMKRQVFVKRYKMMHLYERTYGIEKSQTWITSLELKDFINIIRRK